MSREENSGWNCTPSIPFPGEKACAGVPGDEARTRTPEIEDSSSPYGMIMELRHGEPHPYIHHSHLEEGGGAHGAGKQVVRHHLRFQTYSQEG